MTTFLARTRRRTIGAGLLAVGVLLWGLWSLVGAVVLVWDASISSGVTGYRMYRSIDGTTYSLHSGAAIPADLLPCCDYEDATVVIGQEYWYYATAYRDNADPNPDEESDPSNILLYLAQAPDTTPPTAPGTPTVTAISASQLDLTWAASTDDVGVAGYHVERCQGAGCSSFTDIAQPGGLTYSNTGLTASTLYRYRIRAHDAAGNLSSYSGIGEQTTQTVALGLVAAWAVDENAGTTSVDASGNGHTLTLQGGTTWAVGHTAAGLGLSGTGQYASTPDVAALDLGATGTIEAWVYVTALNRWHGVISKGAANTREGQNYAIEVTDANRVSCVVGNGSAFVEILSPGVLTTNTWVHLACTWDGTTVRQYLNGTQVGTAAQTFTPAANTAVLLLGRFNGDVDYLQGRMDDIRMYNTALSAAQVVTDMQTPVGSGGLPGQVQNVQVTATPGP